MKVLDPFEVADLEMWPFWDLEDASKAAIKLKLNSAEYTLYQELRRQSAFLAILNEKPVEPAPLVQLPASIRTRIVPDAIYERRVHPDLRVARRADTIARLAQVISEREVQVGLRQTRLLKLRGWNTEAQARNGRSIIIGYSEKAKALVADQDITAAKSQGPQEVGLCPVSTPFAPSRRCNHKGPPRRWLPLSPASKGPAWQTRHCIAQVSRSCNGSWLPLAWSPVQTLPWPVANAAYWRTKIERTWHATLPTWKL